MWNEEGEQLLSSRGFDSWWAWRDHHQQFTQTNVTMIVTVMLEISGIIGFVLSPCERWRDYLSSRDCLYEVQTLLDFRVMCWIDWPVYDFSPFNSVFWDFFSHNATTPHQNIHHPTGPLHQPVAPWPLNLAPTSTRTSLPTWPNSETTSGSLILVPTPLL